VWAEYDVMRILMWRFLNLQDWTSIGTVKQGLNSWTAATNAKETEFTNLNSRNEQLKNITARQKQTKEYRRVESVAEQRICEILGSKQLMLHAALGSIIEAFREDPYKQLLIYDPLDYPMISTNSRIPPGIDPRYFKQFCVEKLLELAGKFYDKLLESSLSSTISSVDLAAP
jgi:hypothetical protein